MPKIPLRLDQANARTQHGLQTLNDLLPDKLTVGSGAGEYWVSYPEWFGEVEARGAVRTALARPDLSGIAFANH
jgi:hypothetical protein